MRLVTPSILAFLLSLVLVPGMRWLSHRAGKVYLPRADRWHSKPTATLGGVGIFLAFSLALVGASFYSGNWSSIDWGVLAGAALVFVIGLVDDLRRLSPQAKLGGQILAAALVIALGYTTEFFSPRISNPIVAQLPNILLTFLWLVGICNAINLLDNMDGLAGGVSLIAAGILAYFFYQQGDQGMLSIALALAGAILGFMVFNFPPASIFMGDSGSLFLGFTLAVLAIARQPQASNVMAVMGVPTLLFLLPILDTILVTVTRLLRGQSPAEGGSDHTSHRLIAFGLSERQAVLVLYGVALISGIMAGTLESIRYWYSLVLVPVLIVALALLIAYLGGLKVVSTNASHAQQKGITRVMLDLAFKRRLLEVILDFLLIAIAFYLAILTGNALRMNEALLAFFLQSLPVALIGAYIAFFFSGVYRGVWRFVSTSEYLHFFQAAVGSAVLLAAIVFVLDAIGITAWDESLSPIIVLLFGLFLFLGLTITRSSFKVLDLLSPQRTIRAEERVLICGAGDAGELALRWVLQNADLKLRVVGFLDDDPYLTGRRIHGVPVLGRPQQLGVLLRQKQVSGIILAGFGPDSPAYDDFLQNAKANQCWVRCLRVGLEELLIEEKE